MSKLGPSSRQVGSMKQSAPPVLQLHRMLVRIITRIGINAVWSEHQSFVNLKCP